MPPHAEGMRIGLFGGSFNPPHDAHRLVALTALRRLGLDAVWWLVSPGNPLKAGRGLAPLDARIAAARKLASHPRIHVTGVEAALGTRFTFDTIAELKARCRGVRFVWIMGADNLAQFHLWQNWRGIAGLLPIAVVDRPGASLKAAAGVAAQTLSRYRLSEADGRLLADARPPAWVFLHGIKSPLSSTALREKMQLQSN
ncbi:MAG: nicotinate-nucleotide adenylyltransferase [Phreatobacter sp.]|uniref:nicotinate-nucleotide adenylyltransferase n=1 Tax=Phreatobacter sp. TaxID=1966341 RepID=UPI002735C3C5|nr:nicotinate-nucleotide adenylyltransferase [Phreatobacter sp.]MDP2802581.1 nicotinate-nucleotide adenylyltransferase [Phreatobacter sp.]